MQKQLQPDVRAGPMGSEDPQWPWGDGWELISAQSQGARGAAAMASASSAAPARQQTPMRRV